MTNESGAIVDDLLRRLYNAHPTGGRPSLRAILRDIQKAKITTGFSDLEQGIKRYALRHRISAEHVMIVETLDSLAMRRRKSVAVSGIQRVPIQAAFGCGENN